MEDLMGLAAVITAITTPVVLIFVAVLNKKVAQVDKAVAAVDHAVNGKAPGEQSMVSQVSDIHTRVVPESKG